jgi:hypothetical protein
VGHGDLGHGDLGHGDLGHGDLGHGDLGHGDLGHGDLGHGDLGHGDLGHGDLGHGDLGLGDLDTAPGQDVSTAEASYELAVDSGLFGPPQNLVGYVTGTVSAPAGFDDCAVLGPADCHRNRLEWEVPSSGPAAAYRVYRAITGQTPVLLDEVEDVFFADEELPNGVSYTYFVTSVFRANGKESEIFQSNEVTLEAVNELPIARDDPNANDLSQRYITPFNTNLTVSAPGVVANDVNEESVRDVDSPVLGLTVGTAPGHGSIVVLSNNGSFTYNPDDTYSGDDQFTYKVASPKDPTRTAEATVRIKVSPPPGPSIVFKRTDVWLSTSSANRKFDLKAEVYRNGDKVAERTVTGMTLGSGSTFNKALYKSIGDFPATAFNFNANDTLSVRVKIKVSASSPGGNNASGDIRLWYNVPTPPPANDSHLHAKRNGVDVRYYLITPFKLQKDGNVAGPTQSINKVVYKPDFTELGTWSIQGP